MEPVFDKPGRILKTRSCKVDPIILKLFYVWLPRSRPLDGAQ